MLIIVRGLPGSGKSTLTKSIEEKHRWCGIFSTDDYWFRPDGTYDFNPRLIKDAHKWNFNSFCDLAIQTKKFTCPNDFVLMVDNTNTTWKEFSKYVEVAKEIGHKVCLVEPETSWKFDVEECFKKNTHGVPKETIQKMRDKWEPSEDICREHKIGYLDVSSGISTQV